MEQISLSLFKILLWSLYILLKAQVLVFVGNSDLKLPDSLLWPVTVTVTRFLNPLLILYIWSSLHWLKAIL